MSLTFTQTNTVRLGLPLTAPTADVIVVDCNSLCDSRLYSDPATLPSAVYMFGHDPLYGDILGIVYKNESHHSCVLVSGHGASGFLDMTLNHRSRYYGAVKNLPDKKSAVKRALGVGLLRSYVTMDKNIRRYLGEAALSRDFVYDWDETCAGTVAGSMSVGDGRQPTEIGQLVLSSGVLEPKFIRSSCVDIVYEDSDSTIEDNNRLVYLLGNQLEQLFDPLSEYSPEPTEEVYEPPAEEFTITDSPTVESVCQELVVVQSNFRDSLIDFLQSYLIPLRIQVINGAIPGFTISRLNAIFPPTIDEIARIHNLFQTALKSASPYGSAEIMRAVGMTVPYFYKACMRHEAATRNFNELINEHFDLISENFQAPVPYSVRRMESLMATSLNLGKLKLILDRLMNSGSWEGELMSQTSMYYQAAINTIDSFGQAPEISHKYDKRVFTPTGKILVEFASGWPRQLQYGWINRRVVAIFDVSDIFRNTKQILIIFTDHVLVLEIEHSEKLERARHRRQASGVSFHTVSIADMLMHSLINEVAVPQIPPLSVKAWAPISSVYASEYNFGQNLSLFARGGFQGETTDTQLLFSLTSSSAQKIVELTTKAKIMSKTQPFHLFHHQKLRGLNLFMTVHELQGYLAEQRRSPIAIFLNMIVSPQQMVEWGLDAMFVITLMGTYANVKLTSRFAYTLDKQIELEHLADFINTEVSNLYTLYLSPANPDMVESIVRGNSQVASKLVDFAKRKTQPRVAKQAAGKSMIDDALLVSNPKAKSSAKPSAKPTKPPAKSAKSPGTPSFISPSPRLSTKKSMLSLLSKSPKNSPELNRKDSMWSKLKTKLKSPQIPEEDEIPAVPAVPDVPVDSATSNLQGLGISAKTPPGKSAEWTAETPRGGDVDTDMTPKVVRRKKSFAALRKGIQTNSDEEDEGVPELGSFGVPGFTTTEESSMGVSGASYGVSGTSGSGYDQPVSTGLPESSYEDPSSNTMPSIKAIKKEESHPVFESNPQLNSSSLEPPPPMPASHSHYYTHSGSDSFVTYESSQNGSGHHNWNDSYDSELMGHGRNLSSLDSIDPVTRSGRPGEGSSSGVDSRESEDVKLFDFIGSERNGARDRSRDNSRDDRSGQDSASGISDFSSFHSSDSFADDSFDEPTQRSQMFDSTIHVTGYTYSGSQTGFQSDSGSHSQSQDSDRPTRRMRNLSSSSVAQFRYPAPPNAPEQDESFSSFSYLAGILQGKVALGSDEDGKPLDESMTSFHARQQSKSTRVHTRNPSNRGGMYHSESFPDSFAESTSSSQNLYPDLRDSSIMFLGKYVREKSPSKGKAPMIKREWDSGEEDEE